MDAVDGIWGAEWDHGDLELVPAAEKSSSRDQELEEQERVGGVIGLEGGQAAETPKAIYNVKSGVSP